MPHPTPGSTPVVSPRGVFDADPLHPPTPPPDARAVKIRNSTGRIIAWGWAVAEHSDQLLAHSWNFLEEHEQDGRPPPPCRLMK